MTNGDAVRSMTNEEIAEMITEDRMMVFAKLQETFGAGVAFDGVRHAMYCVLLEWLNREADDAETAT